jgi:hypothetical protein
VEEFDPKELEMVHDRNSTMTSTPLISKLETLVFKLKKKEFKERIAKPTKR